MEELLSKYRMEDSIRQQQFQKGQNQMSTDIIENLSMD